MSSLDRRYESLEMEAMSLQNDIEKYTGIKGPILHAGAALLSAVFAALREAKPLFEDAGTLLSRANELDESDRAVAKEYLGEREKARATILSSLRVLLDASENSIKRT